MYLDSSTHILLTFYLFIIHSCILLHIDVVWMSHGCHVRSKRPVGVALKYAHPSHIIEFSGFWFMIWCSTYGRKSFTSIEVQLTWSRRSFQVFTHSLLPQLAPQLATTWWWWAGGGGSWRVRVVRPWIRLSCWLLLQTSPEPSLPRLAPPTAITCGNAAHVCGQGQTVDNLVEEVDVVVRG